MSDEGEKACPLCAEEMDLTDQHLKPCRCGYEVCVWCWHHIMEMAEKDETEGRCPACRTPYDKEKIVATAANCGRLVAEVSMEKKHKSQKAKSKTSDSRKQLTNVRVIRRNLVYIMGLPLDLADEDLLQHKEYFGKYGKVLKVSMSRTSAGTIQQFPNNTCSVYVTYSREDEAVRCIQSVHSFILDGRPLRAYFGTTKYCHAWLRNVPCSNPDCLYLHEVGSQEDSFTKDEIISAYSTVQQITGIPSNMQRRSGNALPPPADDYCNNSSTLTANPEVKGSSNNSVSSTRISPPSSSSGRSGGLPPAASWGARASNCNPPAVSAASSNGPTKQKAETAPVLPVITSVVSSGPQTLSLPNDIGKRHASNEETRARQSKTKLEASDTVKQNAGLNTSKSVLEAASNAPAMNSTNHTPCNEGETSIPLNTRSFDELPCSPSEHEGGSSIADVNLQKLSARVSSIDIGKQSNGECSDVLRSDGLTLDTFISHRNHSLQWRDPEKNREHGELCNSTSDVQCHAMQNLTSETEDDFDNQRLKDAIVSPPPHMPASSPLHILSHLGAPLQPRVDADFRGNYTVNPQIVYKVSDERLGASVSSNGFPEHLNYRASGQSNSLVNDIQENHSRQFDDEVGRVDSQPALDMGENHIISNILSLDLDSWDDSSTSQNLAKLFGENNIHEGSLPSSNSWKNQISNQSRFSFARQEDSRNHLYDIDPALGHISHTPSNHSLSQGFVENRVPYPERLGNGFGFHHLNVDPSNNFFGGHSSLPSSKLPVSRSQISAPPGFATPSKPPPPGFTSHERIDQSFDLLKSGYQLNETSSFLRNPYQASPSGNISNTNDIEFIDPAILAVGKGRLPTGLNSSALDMRPNFHTHAPGFENESRFQPLMQRSVSPHHSLRYNDIRDNYSPSNDSYGFTSRHMEHPQANHASPYSHFSLQQPRNTVVSNGQWDGWNELQSPNDRVGLDKFYGDSRFQMTNSGDLYNRSFGM